MKINRFVELLNQFFEGNQTKCAELLEYDVRQVRRWVAGDAPIPDTVAMLLETMAAKNISPDKVREFAGLNKGG